MESGFPKTEKVIPKEVPEIPTKERLEMLVAEARIVNHALQNFFTKNPDGSQNGKAIMTMFKGLTPEQLKAINDLMPAIIAFAAEEK